MARRYDSRTTIFSPEGRLYQVSAGERPRAAPGGRPAPQPHDLSRGKKKKRAREIYVLLTDLSLRLTVLAFFVPVTLVAAQVEYAMESISNSGSAIGILCKDGVVLATEKKVISKLLDTGAVGCKREKMYKIDDHVAVAVAGLTADANILINKARLNAQQYLFTYQESMPVEQLVRRLCDVKQGYTQFGGMRPFGVSFLYAGWDEEAGFQLYHSDPSGNYAGWKAHAIGANNQQAQNILNQDWKEDFSFRDAMKLALKVLGKTMDSTSLTSDKVEMSVVKRDEETGETLFSYVTEEELDPLTEEVNEEGKAAKSDD